MREKGGRHERKEDPLNSKREWNVEEERMIGKGRTRWRNGWDIMGRQNTELQ
jgi:hypothetical protein